ncbi:MAG: hypothetical protein IJS14_08735 [Lentisphaeria bacterium]|nr:hypothetical protein [Lentisphaeria bacterium]
MRSLFPVLFLCLAAVLPLKAQYNKSARRGTNKAAAELNSMAREARVSRRVREQLEDQTRLLEYAIEKEQLSPGEQRRIRSILAGVERMLERAEKNGKMTPAEAQNMEKEIHRAYRMLWFLRRNKLDKSRKIVFLGREIVLRDEYRKKFEAGSLNQKEMRDILRAYYAASRVREQLRTDNLSPQHRANLERECFSLLADYFTLAEPAANPGPESKKTAAQPKKNK